MQLDFDSTQIKTIARQVKTRDPALSAALLSLRSDMDEATRFHMAVGILTYAPSYTPESVAIALYLPPSEGPLLKAQALEATLAQKASTEAKRAAKAQSKADTERQQREAQERQREARKNKTIFTLAGPEVDEISKIIPVVGKWLSTHESIYISGGQLSRWSESKCHMTPLNEDNFGALLDRGFSFRKVRITSFGPMDEFYTECPKAVQKTILGTNYFHGIREVDAVMRHPVVTPDGNVLGLEQGYNEDHKLLFPEKTETHTVDLEVAYRTIHDVFHEFPPETIPGAFATMLTLLTRPFMPTAPMICIDAPTQSSGKSLFAKCCLGIVYDKMSISAQSQPKEDIEFDKAAKSYMQQHPGAVMFYDDFSGYIDYNILKTLLTEAKSLSYRILGQSRTCEVKTNRPVVMTGNQLDLSHDIVRRSITIRIDTKLENPSERRCSRDSSELLQYVHANRLHLLSCLLTIAQHALTNATDEHNTRTFASFEEWAKTVGRATMLITADLKKYGLISNKIDGDVTPNMYKFISMNSTAGECFHDIWQDKGGKRWRIQDLGSRATSSLNDLLGTNKDTSNDGARGKRLQKYKDLPRSYKDDENPSVEYCYVLTKLSGRFWSLRRDEIRNGVKVDPTRADQPDYDQHSQQPDLTYSEPF